MTKKWHLVRGHPLRQNNRNDSYHLLSSSRKWNDNLAVGNIDEDSFKISKKTRLLRHQGHPRESDGAIEWRRLLPKFCRDHTVAPQWTTQKWIDHLQRGSDTKRFQYGLVTRKDVSVAWTLTATFSTCVLSKATLEGTE